MNYRRLVLSILITVFALDGAMQACLRLPTAKSPPCIEYREASDVFVGLVVEIARPTAERVPDLMDVLPSLKASLGGGPEVVRFAVEEVFKGDLGDTVHLNQGTTNCDPTYELGERILFYAKRDKANRLKVQTLGRVAFMTDDLDYLRGLPGSDDTTRLSGTVSHSEADLTTLTGRFVEVPEGLRVVAEGEEETYQTQVKDGFFKFVGLPPGKYQVGLLTPHDLHVAFSRQVRYVELVDCASVSYWLNWSATVSGRVVDSKRRRPVKHTSVNLIPVDLIDVEPLFLRQLWESTDKRGNYLIGDVPPGRYYLLTGKGNRHSPSPTFFPGVKERWKALVIEVGRGDKLTGVDVVMDKPRR